MKFGKAYVHNETTLGVLYPGNVPGYSGMTMSVIAGKVQKGGKTFPDAPFTVLPEEIRPATEKDFDYFRVEFHPNYI